MSNMQKSVRSIEIDIPLYLVCWNGDVGKGVVSGIAEAFSYFGIFLIVSPVVGETRMGTFLISRLSKRIPNLSFSNIHV